MGFPSLLIINCKINPILLSLKDNNTNSKCNFYNNNNNTNNKNHTKNSK